MATVLKTVTNYCGNWKKQAINGLPIVKLALDHIALHGDYSPLVHLRLIDNKPVQAQIEMVAAAFGLKFVADETKLLKFTVSGATKGMTLDAAAMVKLERLVSDKAALGGKETADCFKYATIDEKAAADKIKAEKKAEKGVAVAAEKAAEIAAAKQDLSFADIAGWLAANRETISEKQWKEIVEVSSAAMLEFVEKRNVETAKRVTTKQAKLKVAA